MKVLGIETSCDETAASVVTGDGEILSNVVYSQCDTHALFGGVVPEIAARAHLEKINAVIDKALDDAGLGFSDLTAVAATSGPGLIGGLIVGMSAGKAIALARKIPFFAINHLEGHALSPRLSDKIAFPYLLLLVSGGHTQLLAVHGAGHYERWGTTLDDAAGECFDKSAKIMGLGYPGGPQIEKTAASCGDRAAARERFPLPRPLIDKAKAAENACDFSFSGVKTAVRLHVERNKQGLNAEEKAMISASLEETIAEIMQNRAVNAMTRFKERGGKAPRSFVVAGGVAANTTIRKALGAASAKHGFSFIAPPLDLCGDNAAMIAWAACERLHQGKAGDPLDSPARPRWPLDPEAPARQGAGVKA